VATYTAKKIEGCGGFGEYESNADLKEEQTCIRNQWKTSQEVAIKVSKSAAFSWERAAFARKNSDILHVFPIFLIASVLIKRKLNLLWMHTGKDNTDLWQGCISALRDVL
jgi:hypothetical protein